MAEASLHEARPDVQGRVSIVVPSAAHPIVSQSQMLKSVEDCGATMSIDAPSSPSVSRFAAHLKGNAQQVVSAMSRVSVALQEMVDHTYSHGIKLSANDFAEDGWARRVHHVI